MPGTARIGPTDTIGFEGAMTIASGRPERRQDLGRRPRRLDAPRTAPRGPSGAWWRWTKYSWNSSQPSSVRTSVRTGSSVIGRIRAAIPSARWRPRATSVGRVAGPEPGGPDDVRGEVAVAEPEPRLLAVDRRAARRRRRSRRGSPSPARDRRARPGCTGPCRGRAQTSRPWRSTSSPVLTMTASSAPTSAWTPWASLAPPTPPARTATVTCRVRSRPPGRARRGPRRSGRWSRRRTAPAGGR